MPIERDIATFAGDITLKDAQERDPEDIKRLRADKKSRYARILDRGMIHDRLHVDLPEHLHGEWVSNDRISIIEMETLGFSIDRTHAAKMPVNRNDQGDGTAVIGDTIFMVCEKEDKEILDEIRREAFIAANGKPGDVRKSQREEKEFAASNQTLGLPVIEESRERTARKADIEAALRRNAQQDDSVRSTSVSNVVEKIL